MGFESSSGLTPEFANFYKAFKKEFTSLLKNMGCSDVRMIRGHFYVSGFFTHEGGIYMVFQYI
jgi:hypothetical protein